MQARATWAIGALCAAFAVASLAEAKGPAPAAPAAEKARVRAAIEVNNTKWADAQVKGDAQGIVDLFADGGMELFGRVGRVLKGRDSLMVFWTAAMKEGHPSAAKVRTVDVALNGDYATEVGTYAYTYPPDSVGGAPQKQAGRYAVIWRRQADGGWKIWMDTGVPNPQ
ncbi:MAG TPA: nuclear transport factor 2 family protein [Candidatus Saccharimonadaceae bacterium]|jgi:uncharacterized protein (TIGR02246 family)|nr:nuclear transport factor 2 family protein [Candidatus Saccharimonadaceae bacterium]